MFESRNNRWQIIVDNPNTLKFSMASVETLGGAIIPILTFSGEPKPIQRLGFPIIIS